MLKQVQKQFLKFGIFSPPSPAYKNLRVPHDIERGPVCFIMREHCVCVHGLVRILLKTVFLSIRTRFLEL